MARTPVNQDLDAVVDLAPARSHLPDYAYGLVKRTYTVTGSALKPAPAEPLLHDIRPGPDGALPDSLPLGSDFWIYKRLTDVVIAGSAHAPGGRPTHHMEVRCDIGGASKRIAVFGTRHIEWGQDDKPRIGGAAPFTTMPIDSAHAYGGIDTRVPFPPVRSLMQALELAAAHPGAYPRNPDGKGYFVVDERFDGIELPNLENPDDLLTDERLVLGDPRRWAGQPIPWAFDWQPHATFPRSLFLGQRPRFDVPFDGLTEVRMGLLEKQFDVQLFDSPTQAEAGAQAREALNDRFYQEASAGMQLGPLPAGVPIRVTGMRRDGAALSFETPAVPSVELEIAGALQRVEPVITNLVIVPDEGRVLITCCARSRALPRKLIPGIHPNIPLALRVDGERVATYEAPPPIALGSGSDHGRDR